MRWAAEDDVAARVTRLFLHTDPTLLREVVAAANWAREPAYLVDKLSALMQRPHAQIVDRRLSRGGPQASAERDRDDAITADFASRPRYRLRLNDGRPR